MLLRVRTVTAASSIVLLAACGGVHPGLAAEVDGTSISMKTADDMAAVYCEIGLINAAQQGVTSVSNAEARRQAVTDLVRVTVARELAHTLGLSPAASRFELSATQRQQISDAYPGNDEGAFAAIEMNQELTAIAQALGEADLGESLTADNQNAVLDAGMKAIDKEAAALTIDIDPRFGLDSSLSATAPSGSLSLPGPGSKLPTNDDLPETQRCA